MSDEVEIERLGGLAGFGSPRSRLRSTGKVALDKLSRAERDMLEALFDGGGTASPAGEADAFRYRLTKQGKSGPQSVEVAEQDVPATLKSKLSPPRLV